MWGSVGGLGGGGSPCYRARSSEGGSVGGLGGGAHPAIEQDQVRGCGGGGAVGALDCALIPV